MTACEDPFGPQTRASRQAAKVAGWNRRPVPAGSDRRRPGSRQRRRGKREGHRPRAAASIVHRERLPSGAITLPPDRVCLSRHHRECHYVRRTEFRRRRAGRMIRPKRAVCPPLRREPVELDRQKTVGAGVDARQLAQVGREDHHLVAVPRGQQSPCQFGPPSTESQRRRGKTGRPCWSVRLCRVRRPGIARDAVARAGHGAERDQRHRGDGQPRADQRAAQEAPGVPPVSAIHRVAGPAAESRSSASVSLNISRSSGRREILTRRPLTAEPVAGLATQTPYERSRAGSGDSLPHADCASRRRAGRRAARSRQHQAAVDHDRPPPSTPRAPAPGPRSACDGRAAARRALPRGLPDVHRLVMASTNILSKHLSQRTSCSKIETSLDQIQSGVLRRPLFEFLLRTGAGSTKSSAAESPSYIRCGRRRETQTAVASDGEEP